MSYGPPPPWPPQHPGYPPQYPPPPPPRRRRVLWIPIVGGVVILALLGALAFVLFGRGSGEIFLEPAASAGPDPFTSSVDTKVQAASTHLGNRPASSGGTTGGITKLGGEPGLYGGTRNRSSCDASQLIGFLQANPALGQAWAQVQGISVSDIPTYIGALTPVILRSDTRVTNHGFAQGRATPRQSVLEAGTAVLVDAFGVPRARCYCGNPLLQPAAVPVTPSYTGPRWPRFDPGGITVVVQNTTVITVVTLIDLDTGQLFDRPIGTRGEADRDAGRTTPPPTSTPPRPTATPTLTVPPDVTVGEGDVQVTLLWQGPADLDLQVTDPTGFTVSFTSSAAPSGGQLDVDANASCGPPGSDTHVENVFWPVGAAPSGSYSAEVNLFALCGEGSASYQLTVLVDGRVVDSRTGTLTSGSSAPVPFTS